MENHRLCLTLICCKVAQILRYELQSNSQSLSHDISLSAALLFVVGVYPARQRRDCFDRSSWNMHDVVLEFLSFPPSYCTVDRYILCSCTHFKIVSIFFRSNKNDIILVLMQS